VGAFIAGWVLKYFSRTNTLISFSILKIMSLGAYVYLAYAYEQKIKINAWLIYTINALEHSSPTYNKTKPRAYNLKCISPMLLIML